MKILRHFLESGIWFCAVSIGGLVLTCCDARAGEKVNSPASDGRFTWKITGDFHYTSNPRPGATNDHPPVNDTDILTLEKFVVTQHNGARILENLFAARARHHAAEAFSWEKGGIIHESANKRVAVKWIYRGDSRTIELLNFPW